MGSGKSTVAAKLREGGFEVLDADDVARKVLSPGSAGEALVFKTFGEGVRGADGFLDRRALGRVVFGDAVKLQELEMIIHPLVRSEVARRRAELARAGHAAAFYDVPLLFEKNMQTDFDYVVVVTAPAELRRQRVMARSQLTVEEIEERNSRHIDPAVKEAQADAVIRNDGSMTDLTREIANALKKVGISSPAPAKA